MHVPEKSTIVVLMSVERSQKHRPKHVKAKGSCGIVSCYVT